ncbi:MAG: FeoB-associated Cys-rich membrane protein [Clostridia bacterium]|nr:FeoB-associated Cys-rich membrane protein [Clostridia bacterium]
MIDFIVIAILLVIAGGIIFYLYRAKKRGETCIGCPHAKQCGNAGHCSGSCHGSGKKE